MTSSPPVLVIAGKDTTKNALARVTAAIQQKFSTQPVAGRLKTMGVQTLASAFTQMRGMLNSIERMNPGCHFVLVQDMPLAEAIRRGRVWVLDPGSGELLQLSLTAQPADAPPEL